VRFYNEENLNKPYGEKLKIT